MYVDKTRNFEPFWGFRHLTLINCKGTGSSLFPNMINMSTPIVSCTSTPWIPFLGRLK